MCFFFFLLKAKTFVKILINSNVITMHVYFMFTLIPELTTVVYHGVNHYNLIKLNLFAFRDLRWFFFIFNFYIRKRFDKKTNRTILVLATNFYLYNKR